MAKAVEVFGAWARSGRDERMANGHKEAVAHMLSYITKRQTSPFSAIDGGCGNGWVVRLLQNHPDCRHAIGVDGAKDMITKAQSIDPEGHYIHADLMAWSPVTPVDVVHSMEVLYYFKEPTKMMQHMVSHWLKPGGLFIAGVDHYAENKPSLDWAEKTNIDFMTTLSTEQWADCCHSTGLIDVQTWAFAPKEDWAGTLIITGKKPV